MTLTLEAQAATAEKPRNTLGQDVRTKSAACAVFGWSYWADSPHPGCVWASTPEQTFRLVYVQASGGKMRCAIGGQTTDKGILLYSFKSLEWHDFERLPRFITSAEL